MTTRWQIKDSIPDPKTGKARWQIYHILKGGMGVVYIVYDSEWREAFAIKTFQDEIFARNSTIADRFRQEALAWINLDVHQNVTQARFVQTMEGKPFLFLEYISGGELGRWIGTPRLIGVKRLTINRQQSLNVLHEIIEGDLFRLNGIAYGLAANEVLMKKHKNNTIMA